MNNYTTKYSKLNGTLYSLVILFLGISIYFVFTPNFSLRAFGITSGLTLTVIFIGLFAGVHKTVAGSFYKEHPEEYEKKLERDRKAQEKTYWENDRFSNHSSQVNW